MRRIDPRPAAPYIDLMVHLKRILCPTDFSDPSRHALEHAVALARRHGSEITLLYVFPVAATAPDLTFSSPAPLPLGADARRELLESLERFAAPARLARVPYGVVLDEGFAVERILARAGVLGADLIVLGTHGASGFRRLVLGSVAEKVLRLAPCPVLTVPPTETARPAGVAEGRAILCPVDFSECSSAAVELAAELAGLSDARLIVLHVLQAFASDAPRAHLHYGAAEYLHYVEADARERMQALVSQTARSRAPEVVLVSGKAHTEILRVAAERDAGLIVMGVQGRGAFDRMLFGSTTAHVVRAAACPVLTVRLGAGAAPEAPVLEAAAPAASR